MGEERESGKFLYNIVKDSDGKYAEIVKYTGNDGTVEIPDKLGGFFKYPVKAIRNGAFFDEKSDRGLKKVVIPGGVIRLGESSQNAYSNTIGPLLGVLDPDARRRISSQISRLENNKGVFEGCIDLQEVIIPAGCGTIGYCAFGRTYSLNKLELPRTITNIDQLAFFGCGLEKFVFPPSVASVSERLFDGSGDLVEVQLHDAIDTIEACAFSRCKKLRKINIPDSVRSIGTRAFAECPELKEIHIPSSTKIYSGAFDACPAEIIRT